MRAKLAFKDDLTEDVRRKTKEIAELNTERNYLHENINELEKIKEDL